MKTPISIKPEQQLSPSKYQLYQSHYSSHYSSPSRCLINTFKTLDLNSKGSIKKCELKQAIMYTGEQYDRRKIQKQIELCGEDINFQQFTTIFQNANQGHNQIDSCEWLYQLYDEENKGFIDSNDLWRVAQIAGIQICQSEINQMLSMQEKHQNDQINFENFRQIMNQNISMI